MFISVKIWDLEADKCREEFVPMVDVPVRSVSIVSNIVNSKSLLELD